MAMVCALPGTSVLHLSLISNPQNPIPIPMSRRSGRSKQSPDEKLRSDAEDADQDIDDADEVTRCVCGQDELTSIDPQVQQLLQQEYKIKVDLGLFIQCDKCLVWQHGYCVGLFVNEDVPDKYWCEECKPELHLFLPAIAKQPNRTLYKPANDSRARLIEEELSRSEKRAGTRLRARRSPNERTPEEGKESDRQSRKDRRHGNDFDEQLQKALRESAKASGRNDRKRQNDLDHTSGEKRSHSETSDNEVDQSNVEEESETGGQKDVSARRKPQRPKSKSRPPSAKSKGGSTPKLEKSSVNKEELLSQLSKPRFVNDKCTIYELRKRTGAILEWLGRTQMELEEERDLKKKQLAEITENTQITEHFDENLRLMENLTEKILSWEQKFGKYAP